MANLIDITADFAFETEAIKRAIKAFLPYTIVKLNHIDGAGPLRGTLVPVIDITPCGGSSESERKQIWEAVYSIIDPGEVAVQIHGHYFR